VGTLALYPLYGYGSPTLMVRRRESAVSNHEGPARAIHPSRRAFRAPQDEV
jgi:hypothetical protein